MSRGAYLLTHFLRMSQKIRPPTHPDSPRLTHEKRLTKNGNIMEIELSNLQFYGILSLKSRGVTDEEAR